jgi:excisionase family DNA binding protein
VPYRNDQAAPEPDAGTWEALRPQAPLPKLLLTPEQAGYALGIGRTGIYALLTAGALPSIKLGRSRRISTRALQAYVDCLEAGGQET